MVIGAVTGMEQRLGKDVENPSFKQSFSCTCCLPPGFLGKRVLLSYSRSECGLPHCPFEKD